MRMLFLVLVVALSTISSAMAGPFEDGLAVHKRRDYATALPVWRPRAERGNADAQDRLGTTYRDGEGVPQDYAEAVRWYRKAAEQGYAPAQTNLGVMYQNGWGVPQNYDEAVSWYLKAADRGDADAQDRLDSHPCMGGFSCPAAEAVRWYRKVAELGRAGAQTNLGVMYQNGWGVPQNYEEAAKWYWKAAEQGHRSAQIFLGLMYETGEGVPRIYVLAHQWFNLAAARETDPKRREEAVKARDRVAAKMTPAEIAQAQHIAREWKPKPER